MSKRRGCNSCLVRFLIFGLIFLAMAIGVGLIIGEAAEGWGLRPDEDGLGWFDLSLQPGDTYESALLLVNQSDDSVTLVVSAVDEVNAQRGGFSLANQPGGLTQWLDFPEQTITLDHHSQKRLPFTLAIPSNANPADYGAGFVAYEPFDSDFEDGLQIIVVNRVGVSLLARVGDPNECGIRFEGARFNASSEGGVSIQLDLTNTGNVAFEGAGVVRIKSNHGDVDWSNLLDVDFSLSGPILYPIHAPVDPGAYQLEAEVWSVDQSVCRDTLAASFDLQPLPEPEQEPTALGDLFEGLFSAAAEGQLGNLGPNQTPYPVDLRLIIGIALAIFGLVFGGGWIVWLTWLLTRRKGKKRHKRGSPPHSNRERLNWRNRNE